MESPPVKRLPTTSATSSSAASASTSSFVKFTRRSLSAGLAVKRVSYVASRTSPKESRGMPTRRIPLIAIVALLAVACGTAGGGTGSTAPGLAGTLVGAGASSQAAAMDGWKAGFAEVEPGVTVEYDPI